jgi:hypothetical protein
MDLSMKPRDPEAPIRVALDDVRCLLAAVPMRVRRVMIMCFSYDSGSKQLRQGDACYSVFSGISAAAPSFLSLRPLFGSAYPEAIRRTAASALRGSGPQMLVATTCVDDQKQTSINLNHLNWRRQR